MTPPRPLTRRSLGTILAPALLASAAILSLLGSARAAEEERTFVGSQTCSECHPQQTARWRGSDHELAIQVADESTVLGDFDDATYDHFGMTSRFFRKDGRFFVRTDGPLGELADFEVRYTFGHAPLQQYLVAFPDGRYQVLPLSWDSRAAAEGGQRWFHIYPRETIPHDDVLHWTGPNQNWNHMCAECHSTNLTKGYDLEAKRFDTAWSELSVGCEACHGPGSRHIAWTKQRGSEAEAPPDADRGFPVRFERRVDVRWALNPASRKPQRTPRDATRAEVEACARCHSRRSPLTETYEYGRPLADTHRLAFLDDPLYFADGQIREEVYVHGSFLQSAMYRAGVTCSDCHDPHSGGLRAEGNALCVRCHDAARFDSQKHHAHAEGSEGASCVECHMPSRTYMEVDPRRDHSLRIPRPDLSDRLGTPNPCVDCHKGRTNTWAAKALAKQRRSLVLEPHWGEAIHAGRTSALDAEERLTSAFRDSGTPDIARASMIELLAERAGPRSAALVEEALQHESPWVRIAALSSLQLLDPSLLTRWGAPLLRDPDTSVRLEAARILAPVPDEQLDAATRARRDTVMAELEAELRMNADRGETHVRLGSLRAQQGKLTEAEAAYLRALELAPGFLPAHVNLADLYRVLERESEAEAVLRQGLATAPESADLHHALGLSLVRGKQLPEAVASLERAATLRPDLPRYAYVYAVALHSTGDTARALEVLRAASERHPGDANVQAFRRQLEGGSGPAIR